MNAFSDPFDCPRHPGATQAFSCLTCRDVQHRKELDHLRAQLAAIAKERDEALDANAVKAQSDAQVQALRAQLVAVTKERDEALASCPCRPGPTPDELHNKLNASTLREAALRERLADIATVCEDKSLRDISQGAYVVGKQREVLERVWRLGREALSIDPSHGVEFLSAAREWADAQEAFEPKRPDFEISDLTGLVSKQVRCIAARRKERGE